MSLHGFRDYYCPRLLDYFLIVGSQKHISNETHLCNPVILKQFPPIGHDDFPLPPETVYFCQPDPPTSDINSFSSVGKLLLLSFRIRLFYLHLPIRTKIGRDMESV